MVEARDVAVVGGGFAGLSAAVALSARGFRVAVLEGKPALGGRAYSFADPESGDFVDNGQHVLMGCYAETLKFIERIGARDRLVFQNDLAIRMLERDGRSGMLRTARLPGPLHMTAALIRYPLLAARERASALTAGLRLLRLYRRERARLADMTVDALMDELGQGERARRCLWYPIAIATLNENPEAASAALLAEVLRRAFFGRRADSAFVYARVGLSDLYCLPSARLIEAGGGVVETRALADAFELGPDDASRACACATAAGSARPTTSPRCRRRSCCGFCRTTCALTCFSPAPAGFPARRLSASTHGSIAKSPTRRLSASSARRRNGSSTSAASSPSAVNGRTAI